jgi:hypothetical protein
MSEMYSKMYIGPHVKYLYISPHVKCLYVGPHVNTLATGYGDFRTSVASGRSRATEISVFKYGWMEEGLVLLCVTFVVI